MKEPEAFKSKGKNRLRDRLVEKQVGSKLDPRNVMTVNYGGREESTVQVGSSRRRRSVTQR
jgi:hypothetical protein